MNMQQTHFKLSIRLDYNSIHLQDINYNTTVVRGYGSLVV